MRQRRLFQRLFEASIAVSAFCLVIWVVSLSQFTSLNLKPACDGEVRIYNGAVYLKYGEQPATPPPSPVVSGRGGPRVPIATAAPTTAPSHVGTGAVDSPDPWPGMSGSSYGYTYTPDGEQQRERYQMQERVLGMISVNTANLQVVGISFWTLIGLLGVYQAWWLLRGKMIVGRRFARGHCAGCGYKLAGLESDFCPECGLQYRLTLVAASLPRPGRTATK